MSGGSSSAGCRQGDSSEAPLSGHPITITAVADRAGIARSTIYRNHELRTMIEHHQTAPDGTITAITDELATLRTSIQTLADTVRQHDTKIRRLARN